MATSKHQRKIIKKIGLVEYSKNRFDDLGIDYVITNNGAHFVLYLKNKIHFWPSTERWRLKLGAHETNRGFFKLLKHIMENEL